MVACRERWADSFYEFRAPLAWAFFLFQGDVLGSAIWEGYPSTLCHCFNHLLGAECPNIKVQIWSDSPQIKWAIKKLMPETRKTARIIKILFFFSFRYDLMGQQTVVVVARIDFSLKIYCWRRNPIAIIGEAIFIFCKIYFCSSLKCLWKSEWERKKAKKLFDVCFGLVYYMINEK